MNLRAKNKIIRTIFNNLRETKELIHNSSSINKKLVEVKYVATIQMLLDGSEAIKDMIKDDLENEEKITMES